MQRKVSRIWGETRGRATERERVLILAREDGAPRPPVEVVELDGPVPRTLVQTQRTRWLGTASGVARARRGDDRAQDDHGVGYDGRFVGQRGRSSQRCGACSVVDLTGLEVASTYATGREDLFGFLTECFSRSVKYDRAAGYFSSALYDAARVAISDFQARGGKIRLVCSPFLDRRDFDEMESGLSLRSALDRSLMRDIGELRRIRTDGAGPLLLGEACCRRNPVGSDLLPREDSSGLFHTKLGIFTDRLDSRLAFIGSANETWRAWSELGNHESFAAFATWTNAVDAERVVDLKSYFEQLWDGIIPGLITRELPDAPRDHLLDHASDVNTEDLADEIRALVERHNISARRTTTSVHDHKMLQPHQAAVLEDWRRRGERGIVAHVTGAGKTVTAISAIRDWIASGRPALVVVPRELLQTQWSLELKAELSDLAPMILLVGGRARSRDAWSEALADQTRPGPSLGPRIVVAVLASASSDEFLARVQASPDLLVVGDEVHTMGAPQARRLLAKLQPTKARLGLSATWQRAGDAEGTGALAAFFGAELEPAFGIADAIAAGRLVPYVYNVETCPLSEDEEAEFDELTEQIGRVIAREEPETVGDYLKMLLIKRARILKNAQSKTPATANIVLANFKRQQHWLLYCDNRTQVAQLIEILEQSGILALEYHSAMEGDRGATLTSFVEDGGVLVAIKCLDEGVDLPVLDHAVILASSTNPREYIQRRGRVLRTASGKSLAKIWDLVAITADEAPASVNEVIRVGAFAAEAFNRDIVATIDDLVTRGKIAGRIDVNFEDGEENGGSAA